jgi:phosphohistidine phosphatase
MRTLLLMRHAKSSWDNPHMSDHDRPLNERGLRDAPRMGHLIENQGLPPSLIVSSTAVRARETAHRVAEACRFTGDIVLEPRLYHATTGDWKQVISELPASDERVLCVGHNPGLEELLKRWTSESVEMPTAALAVIDLHVSDWADYAPRTVSLAGVFRPKELDDSASA